MFKSSFRGVSLPLALAGASLSLVLAGCGGGGGTNLPTPGDGTSGLGGGGGGPQIDNNTIVFVSTRDGNPEIYSIKSDGNGAKRLTNNAAIDERPSRSVDGRTVVFSSNRDGNFEIYKINADGSNLVRLTQDAADGPEDTKPVFSKDGSKIVWQSTRAAAPGGQPVRRLYIMDASGENQRPVVFDDVNQPSFDGAWNPDNSRLLGFLVNPNDNANNDLAIITPGDGNTTAATANIIRAGTRSAHARYSSAGARIVLSDGITGVGQLQLLNPDGTLIGNGPTGGVDQSNPSFNPQGTRLTWDARPTAGTPRQLYVSDLATGTAAQPAGKALTTQGENYQASWAQ